MKPVWLPPVLSVGVGAALLSWPAFVNGYPIVFSDTAGLADMALAPTMGWDKPWVYGPVILLLHWVVSLWGVVAGQAVAVSAMLWLVARGGGRGWAVAAPVGLCAVLAVGSALPWFVPFVMPDVLAPVVVLCLYRPRLGAHGRAGAARRGAVGDGGDCVPPRPPGAGGGLPAAGGGAPLPTPAGLRRAARGSLGLAARQQRRRQRCAGCVALWLGLRLGAAAGRRTGGGLPPQRLPGRWLSLVRLVRAHADGQRRLPLVGGRTALGGRVGPHPGRAGSVARGRRHLAV